MIKRIINFTFTIILIFVFFILFFVITNQNLISTENLSKYIDNENILNVNASYVLNTNDNVTLEEKLYQIAIDLAIPDEIISDLLDSNEINNVLGYFFSNSINGNEVDLTLEILEIMKAKALESSENHLNIVMDNDILLDKVEKFYFTIKDLMPERLNIIGDTKILSMWEFTLNYNYIYIILALLLIIVSLFLINKNIFKCIKVIGISLCVTGNLYVLIGALNEFLNNYITEQLNGTKILLSPLITNLFTSWFLFGVSVSFIGIFIIILANFIGRLNSK